jgi:hypothetical protein
MTRLFVGIDPGAAVSAPGAVGVIDEAGRYVSVTDLGANVGDLHDTFLVLPGLEMADGDPFLFALEEQQSFPGQGVASSFKLGAHYGALLGLLTGLGYPHRLVRPAKWKQHLGLSRDKERSRAMARQLWPSAPLSRVKDHGRSEALLLAEWLRRQEMKQ